MEAVFFGTPVGGYPLRPKTLVKTKNTGICFEEARRYQSSPTKKKIRQAVTVVPGNYCHLNCWTCREEGHSTFIFPFLQPSQRLYFAYRYYLYQISANPTMANYFEDLIAWRLDPKNDRPRPFHDRRYEDRGAVPPSRRGGYGVQRGQGILSMRRGGSPIQGGGNWRSTGLLGVFLVYQDPEIFMRMKETPRSQ